MAYKLIQTLWWKLLIMGVVARKCCLSNVRRPESRKLIPIPNHLIYLNPLLTVLAAAANWKIYLFLLFLFFQNIIRPSGYNGISTGSPLKPINLQATGLQVKPRHLNEEPVLKRHDIISKSTPERDTFYNGRCWQPVSNDRKHSLGLLGRQAHSWNRYHKPFTKQLCCNAPLHK